MPSLYARVWLSSVWTTSRMVHIRCSLPPPYKRRKTFRRSRSNGVVAAKRLRDLRVRLQACPSINEPVKNQEEQVPRTSVPICPSTSFRAWVTNRAPENLLLGCRPAIARTNPKVTEPLRGQKEVLGRVAHEVRGASYQAR